jgi:hypothetical protein
MLFTRARYNFAELSFWGVMGSYFPVFAVLSFALGLAVYVVVVLDVFYVKRLDVIFPHPKFPVLFFLLSLLLIIPISFSCLGLYSSNIGQHVVGNLEIIGRYVNNICPNYWDPQPYYSSSLSIWTSSDDWGLAKNDGVLRVGALPLIMLTISLVASLVIWTIRQKAFYSSCL